MSKKTYDAGLRDGMLCGLVHAAVIAIETTRSSNEGNMVAAALIRSTGVSTLADLNKMRNDPLDEYDLDFLLGHLDNMSEEELAHLAGDQWTGRGRSWSE